MPAPRSSPRGHVIVCGTDHLGRRTIDELVLRRERVVVIAGSSTEAADLTPDPHVQVLEGDSRRESVLREAGVDTADAIVMAGDNDLGNLNTALAAHEINPRIRLVIRMFDPELGAHLPELFPDAVTLSSSALAAPGFASAAIDGEAGERFELAGQVLTARTTPRSGEAMTGSARRSEVPAHPAGFGDASPTKPITIPIARIRTDRTVDLLPEAAADDADLIVVDVSEPLPTAAVERAVGAQGPRSRLALTSPRGWRPPAADQRLVRFAAVLIGLVVLSAVFFELTAHLSPLDALSYAITLLTGASLPTSVDPDLAPAELKLYAIVLSIVGAAIVAVVYALITDAIVRSRLLQTLGRRNVPSGIRDHVIVCGLGSIGYRIAQLIAARGVPVVAIEPDENGRFVGAARAVGIPVLVGDARQKELLLQVGVRTCRALIAATSDDLVNLSAALNARAVRRDLRVVVRLFDPEFALRVQRGFHIRFTRSVSHLAAPAFAAAAVGSEVVATIPVGDRRVILFARVRVPEGSALAGRTVGSLDVAGDRRVVALLARWEQSDEEAAPATWLPKADHRVAPNEEIVVAATRAGLASLGDLARTPATAAAHSPGGTAADGVAEPGVADPGLSRA